MAPGIIEDVHTAQASATLKSIGPKHTFPEHADSAEYARSLDYSDPLRAFRAKFIIPSKAALKTKTLSKISEISFISVSLSV